MTDLAAIVTQALSDYWAERNGPDDPAAQPEQYAMLGRYVAGRLPVAAVRPFDHCCDQRLGNGCKCPCHQPVATGVRVP